MPKVIIFIKRISKRLWLRMKYGKYGHWRYVMAEDAVIRKIPVIDQIFTRKERKSCFLKGFNSDKLVWYGLDGINKGGYISDYDHFTIFEAIDRKQYYVADDKLVCERMLAPFCRVIPTIGYIVDGTFFPIGNDKDIKSYEDFVNHINRGEEFYIKPNFGGSGRGIGRLTFQNDSYWWNDKKVSDIKGFIKSFDKGKGYLVQRRFKQTGFSHDVNPHSVNTIRCVTMLSPTTKTPFIAGAAHRFGLSGSYVDNIAKGNVLCPINIDTGKILFGVLSPIDGRLQKVDVHPDTGKQLSGIVIPHWNEVKELCLRLAKQLPFMPLCGWDIVISGDDVYMQELNYNPDIYLIQLDRPLLEIPEVFEFYSYYKKKIGHVSN